MCIAYTDRRLAVLCWAGIVISALLVAGVPQLAPPWVPMLAFLMLWTAYMSITSIGQTLYGFGWEMLLSEAGVLAAFLGGWNEPPPTLVIVLFWWLVFRLEFGAGLIKLRGGEEWRDLTALMYHHETQPMPGPLSRQAHLLPAWFHRFDVLGNHFAQIVVPWFVFAPILSLWIPGVVPVLVGAVAAGIVILSQLWLVSTGNFAWLNWATIVLACSALGVPGSGEDGGGSARLPLALSGIPVYWAVITAAVFALYVFLSGHAVRNLCARHQLMNASFSRWQLANAYGAFGTVMKERIEYAIEGTQDPDPASPEAEWREYAFKGRPGGVRRVPRQYAPYHLRLDWLMWFLPLGRGLDGWFRVLLQRLLEADRPTLKLLASDPFAGAPPRYLRVVSYRYRFTTRAERREDGGVWVRDRRRMLVPPVTLGEYGA